MIPIKPFFCSLLAGMALSVNAHDTWFVPGQTNNTFYLNTGSHFPQSGSPVDDRFVRASGCVEFGEVVGEPVLGMNQRFELRHSLPHSEGSPFSCWAELKRNSTTLEPKLVKQYLNETRAPAKWSDHLENLVQSGEVRQESFRKSARIEVSATLSEDALALPFQARLAASSPHREATVGKSLRLQVLLHGQPIAGQAVELLIDSAPVGFWYKTDAQGEVDLQLPVPGQALLRATHFAESEGQIRTEFLTYSFVVNL